MVATAGTTPQAPSDDGTISIRARIPVINLVPSGCGGDAPAHTAAPRSRAPLWMAIMGLAGAVLLSVVVSSILASKNAEITALETDKKIEAAKKEVVATVDGKVDGLKKDTDQKISAVTNSVTNLQDNMRDAGKLLGNIVGRLDKVESQQEKADRLLKRFAGRLNATDAQNNRIVAALEQAAREVDGRPSIPKAATSEPTEWWVEIYE